MKKAIYLLFFLFNFAQISAQDDRKFWVATLDKIAWPVVENIANGTLHKNMPLETPPDYYKNVKEVTYLEAVGRCLAGIAPWLELPDDTTEEGILRKKYKDALIKGLPNLVNPNHADYLNFKTDNQPIVDAAFLVHAFLRAPNALWKPLDPTTKTRFVKELKSLRTRSGAYNNWLLFAALTEGFLRSIGEEFDPVRIDFALNKMEEWYAGDGWYADGQKFSMDYYNSFVIHSMYVDLLKTLQNDHAAQKNYITKPTYNLAIKRMARYSEFLERVIAPDGTFPVFGRSMTYRSAVFQALGHTALIRQLPSHLPAAQVRSALTKVYHKLYDGPQNFDKNGWLVLGFNGHQPSLADPYTSTGSLYMATLGFLPLGLPKNDEFWSAPAQPWTSQKVWEGQEVKKDYKVDY